MKIPVKSKTLETSSIPLVVTLYTLNQTGNPSLRKHPESHLFTSTASALIWAILISHQVYRNSLLTGRLMLTSAPTVFSTLKPEWAFSQRRLKSIPLLRVLQCHSISLRIKAKVLTAAYKTLDDLAPYSVQFSCSVMSDSLQPHGLQHARLPCSSPTPEVCSNSCPSSWWCHPTISSFIFPFSSCLQSFPASGSFLVSHFFSSGGQSIGVSASASVLPMNIQDWFPSGFTDLISWPPVGFFILLLSLSEKAMTPHSSTLAWKIPWTEEPGRLQSMGSRRVGHNWATSLSLSYIGKGNGNPLQCSCLENPRDGGAWWAAVCGVTQCRTWLKWLSSSTLSICTGLSHSRALSAPFLVHKWLFPQKPAWLTAVFSWSFCSLLVTSSLNPLPITLSEF